MAKTLFKDWYEVNSGKTETVQIDATRIDSAKVKWRGKLGKLYGSATRSDGYLPSPPSGTTFDSHSAYGTAYVTNNGTIPWTVTVSLITPWRTVSKQVTVPAQSQVSVGLDAGTTYTNYVGQRCSIAAYNTTPECYLSGSSLTTKTIGYWTEPTVDPRVTVNSVQVGHTGTLNAGVESPEYDANFQPGSNSLTHSISGGLVADFSYTVLYQPKLAAPGLLYPSSGGQMKSTEAYVELQLPSDIFNDATALHVKLEWAYSADFAGATVYDTRTSQTGWTYWNGSAWTAFPAGGAPQGSRVRYTFQTQPAVGQAYFRATIHDGWDWGYTSSTWTVYIVLGIVGQIGVQIGGRVYPLVDAEIAESCNGEVSTISLAIENATSQYAVTLDSASEFQLFQPSQPASYDVTVHSDGCVANSASTATSTWLNLAGGTTSYTIPMGNGQTLIAGVLAQRISNTRGRWIKSLSFYLFASPDYNITIYVTVWKLGADGYPAAYVTTLGSISLPKATGANWRALTLSQPWHCREDNIAIILGASDVGAAWGLSTATYAYPGLRWTGSSWSSFSNPLAIQVVLSVPKSPGQYVSALRLGAGHVKFETVETKPGTTSIQHYASVFPEGVSPMPEPTFSRASVAYKSDGTQVAANVPRYETGAFNDPDGAIVVEEPTQNLLTANQSSVETDLTGLSAVGAATISRDTTEFWHGTSSVRVVCPGSAANEGVWTISRPSASAGLPYTASAYLKGSGSVRLRLSFYNSAAARLSDFYSETVVLTNSWQRVAVTGTADATAVTVALFVLTPTAQAITFYVDGLQIEQKPYATSWTLGGSTRSPETPTIPTAGVLNPQEGTVECWVYVPEFWQLGIPYWRRIWGIGRTAGAGMYVLRYNPTNGNIVFAIYDDSGTAQNISVAKPSVGWHYFAAKWSASEMALLIDGVKVGSITNPNLPSSFADTVLSIGCRPDSPYDNINTLIDDPRISSRARADAEIAVAYASGKRLPVDEWTTYKACFDGNLWTGNWDEVAVGSIIEVPTAGTLYVRSILTAADNQTPAIDKETFTHQAPSQVPGGTVTELAYQSNVDVGIRDYAGTLKLYRGRLWKKEPQGFKLRLLASNGDQILLDRFISANYSSQDLGTTLRSIIATDCAPLVNTDIPATLGYVAPLSLQGERAMKAFDEVRKRFGVLFWVYWTGTEWRVKCIKQSDLAAPTMAIVWGNAPVPGTLQVVYMQDEPRVEKRPLDATKVTVRVRNSSPVVQATAELSGIPADQKVEQLIEIDSGTVTDCENVANAWLAVHGREQECITCRIDLNCSLSFDRQVWVAYPAAGINRAMAVQRIVHRPLASPPHTEVTLGDFVPGDEEILARLLEGVKV